mmetsp:Transcript_95178/g.269400  ORF Transcript_95178/g.269400 Transcript_95178/m.269400 type:complete len:445 (+) Transcript_95178:1099-2433(+)
MVEFANLGLRDLALQIRDPVDLLLRVLHVALGVQASHHFNDLARALVDDALVHVGVAPMKQRHLFSILDLGCVLLVHPDVLAEHDQPLPHLRVLGVLLVHLSSGYGWPIEPQKDGISPVDGRVPRHDRVDDLLVDGPDLVPLHQVRGLRHALGHDELLEAFHGHAPPEDTLDRGESRIAPTFDHALLNEHRELSLGEDRVRELRLRELHQLDGPDAGCLLHPLVHVVAVLVLDGSQGMRHAFQRVHDGACEVVGGIRFVLRPVPVMRNVGLAAIEDRVAQALVLALHVHLRPHAAPQALGASLEHLAPQPEVLLLWLGSPLAVGPGVALLPHLRHLGVVHVGLVLLEQFLHDFLQLGEVVGGVAHHVWKDLQRRQVLDDAVYELDLLLARVRVVEAQDELAFVVPGVVVVQHRGLGVADVEVAAGFRGETSAHLSLYGVGQQAL